MTALLEVRGLEVFFDLPSGELHAVQGVDFELEAGERLGLVGESGSGKTTTVLALMGLLPPNASVAGRVMLDGKDLLAGGEAGTNSWRWSQVATVFQGAMNSFNPVRPIGWQIAEPMRVHGAVDAWSAKARTRELLAMVDLPAGVADAYPHELSGGMRQRAAIAMALACAPKVLLADEPTTALDVVVQAGILDLLRQLADELGLALVLVTHDLAAAAAVCTRAAVMYAGRIVETAPVEQLGSDPRHPYTRALFAAIPALHDDHAVAGIPGAPPRLDRPVVGCPFAPRCAVTMDGCTTDRPSLRVIDANRSVACHRAADDPLAMRPVEAVTASVRAAGRAGDTVLAVDDLAVRFPRRRSALDALRRRPRSTVRALDGVTVEVGAGELVAVVGESGSGKTTLAQAVVGNVGAASGRVIVDGVRIDAASRRERAALRRRAQLVYQDPYESLDPRMQVRAILEGPLRANRIGRRGSERLAMITQALATVGLAPAELYLDRFPHELSGGQRQRVAIAAALVMSPAIIVADEPVSMLDVSVRAEVLDVFDALRAEHGVTVVMITHDLSTAAHYADRIVVMYLGRIVEQGPAREVVDRPRHPYTRALLAAVPKRTIGEDAEETVLHSEIPDASNLPSGCRFHPRCPVASDGCAVTDPQPVLVSPKHTAACVLAS